MKKLVLLLAVVFSASLFSCGSSDKAAEAADTAAVVEAAGAAEEIVAPDTIRLNDSTIVVGTDTIIVAVEAVAPVEESK